MVDQTQEQNTADRSWTGRLLHTWNVFVEAPSRAANSLVSAGAGALGLLDDASKHLGLSEHTISENLLGYDLKPQEAFNAWLDPKTKARQEYLYGEVIKPETFVEHTIQAAADVGVASAPIAASSLAAPVASAATKALGPVFNAAKALPGFALRHPIIATKAAIALPIGATAVGTVGTELEVPGAETLGRAGAQIVDWQSSASGWIGDKLGPAWGMPFNAMAWTGHAGANLARHTMDSKNEAGPNPDGFLGNLSDNPLLLLGMGLGLMREGSWFDKGIMAIVLAIAGIMLQKALGPEGATSLTKGAKELASTGGQFLSNGFNAMATGGASGVARNLGLDHIGQTGYSAAAPRPVMGMAPG